MIIAVIILVLAILWLVWFFFGGGEDGLFAAGAVMAFLFWAAGVGFTVWVILSILAHYNIRLLGT